jgi:hypothetical protein
MEQDEVRHTLLPVLIGYGVAILVGIALPEVAIGLYCLLALYLVVPFGEIARLFRRS